MPKVPLNPSQSISQVYGTCGGNAVADGCVLHAVHRHASGDEADHETRWWRQTEDHQTANET